MFVPSFEGLFERFEDDNIKRELARIRPDDRLNKHLAPLLGLMRGEPLREMPEGDIQADLFLQQIGRVARMVNGDRKLAAGVTFPSVRIAGSCYDFLDQECQAPWSIAKLLNFLTLVRIQPTHHAAVVATMRDDGVSMLEFIAHYRALGFDHIFIFSNDNVDGTTEMLELLARHGVITYIDNQISENTSPQRKAFEYSIHFMPQLRDYEWVLYVDSDEFLMPAEIYDFSIRKVIDSIHRLHPVDVPSAILYSWKWFGGHSFERGEGMQLERFEYSRKSTQVKSLVRFSDVLTMRPLHFPISKKKTFFVDSTFERIEQIGQLNKLQPNYDGGQLNHYWHKSFKEFALKKRRGDKLQVSGGRRNDYKRGFEQFFLWNVPLEEQYHTPCSQRVVLAVRSEVENLLGLPGVRATYDDIQMRFEGLLQPPDGTEALQQIFEQYAANYPRLGFPCRSAVE
nr:glycosyltransferase family 2 protein [uncultured Rhodopila sp.]